MRWLSKSHCDWRWIYVKVTDVCNVHKTFLHFWGSIHTLNWLVTKPLIWNLTKETLCGSRSKANAGGFRRGKLRQKQRHTRDITAIDLTGTSHWQMTETVASHDILKPVKSVKLVANKWCKGARTFTWGREQSQSAWRNLLHQTQLSAGGRAPSLEWNGFLKRLPCGEWLIAWDL